MHLTDDQLNEYLDKESNERAHIESHLAICADCAARLTALQALFAEIESLPELELTSDLAVRVGATPGLIPQLPRWLTLTAILQAVFGLIALLVAAPFIARMLPPITTPSVVDLFLQLRSAWLKLFENFLSIQLPVLPELPALEISSIALSLTLAGVSMLWLVGNGLLLRNYMRRPYHNN